jgi:O-antigen/teichoic acid export membrane protein
VSASLPEPVPDGSAATEAVSLRRIVRNGSITFLAVVISSVLSLITVIVLARGLGKDALGEYYTIFALVTTVQLLAECGISTVITTRVINAREAWKTVVAEAMGLLTLVSLLSGAALLGCGAFLADRRGDPTLLVAYGAAAVACVGLQVQQFAAGVFRALERFEYECFARVAQGMVFVAIVVLFLHRGPQALQASVFALAASHAFAALVMIVSLQWGWRCLGLRLHARSVWSWVGESIPLAFGDFFRRLTMQIDTLLLSALTTSAAVAIYNLACRPLAGLTLLPRMLLWVTFPAFVRLAAGNRADMARAFVTSTRLLWVASLPLAVVVCICAEHIALILGGSEYLEAAVPIRILVWILILIFLSAQFRLLFTALGRQRLYMILVTAVFVVETALEAGLIPVGGYLGLCVGFLLGEIIYVAAGLVVCHYLGLRGIEWGRFATATLGAVLMGAALWPTRALGLPLVLLLAALATVVYFIFCYLTGAILREEGERLWHAVARLVRRGPRRPTAAVAGVVPGLPASTIDGTPDLRVPTAAVVATEAAASATGQTPKKGASS